MGESSGKKVPTIRVRTPEGTARVLRAHFAKHNQRVLLLALGTLVAALAAWVLLYFFSVWMIILGVSALDRPNLQVPQHFWVLFSIIALCAICIAWMDNRLNPNARPRDKKSAFEIVLEFLLAVPRMTLAVVSTLRAWQSLSDAELLQASELLHRLGREKRVPTSSVRLEIPDPESALRILFALQMTQVIDSHRDENEFWLRLSSLRPTNLRMADESARSQEPGAK